MPTKVIAPSYSQTRTGILGAHRETMFANQILLKDKLAHPRPRGYIQPPYPGEGFIYGIPYPQHTGGVNEAMHGWPGSEFVASRAKIVDKTEPDFIAMNRMATKAGLVTVPEHDQYRATHEIRRCTEPERREITSPTLRLPPDFVYGIKTRPSTPLFDLIEHKYQDKWIQKRREIELAKRKREVAKKVDLLKVSETRTSLLRQFEPPVDKGPLWQMKKFKLTGPHLDTFRTDKDREGAFNAHAYDRFGRKGTKKQGNYVSAQDHKVVVY